MTVKINPKPPMKLTVCALNLAGFLFYFAYIGVLTALWGMPNKLFFPTILVLTPFPYFVISFITSFSTRRSGGVLAMRIIAHAIVAVASIAAVLAESYWPLILFILYAIAWFTMYLGLPERNP